MLSFFFFFSWSAVLGFDIGGDSVRAALIRTGQNIEILNSEEEERKFPTVLTIVPNQQKNRKSSINVNVTIPDIINESDVSNFTFLFNDWNAIKKYPNSTIRYPAMLMAKIPTDEFVALAQNRRLWGTPSLYHDDRILISGVLPEIPIHRAFLKINATVNHINDGKGKVEQVAIAVPDFYPQQERDSLRWMAKSIKYKPYIVDQMRALASWYAYHNAKMINTQKSRVVFFLFGETNLQISLVTFHKFRNETISINQEKYAFDDTIGGRDIDVLIADFIAKQFNYPITPKAEQLLLIEAAKIKKKLTVIKHVTGIIESIDGLHDLIYNISYNDYKKLLIPILKNITICSQKITSLITGKKPISKIMLIGGSSRIPIVQDHIKAIFSTNQIYTSMLKDEMIATSAAMFQASMSPDYLLPSVVYKSKPLYKIELRTERALLPFDGTLPFRNSKYWLQESADFYPTGSSIFMVWNIAGKNTTMRQTKDGLWRFKNPLLRKYHIWLDQLLSIAFTVEKQETERIELQKLINEMEYLLLETKETLSVDSTYATAREKAMLTKAYNVTNRWFLAQKAYDKKTLIYRTKMLEDAVGSVLCRAQNDQFLPETVKNMSDAFEFAYSNIEKWNIRSKRPAREDIRTLLRMIAETKIWYREMERKQLKLSPLDNPILSYQVINEKTNVILKFVNDLAEELGTGSTSSRVKAKMNDGVYVYPPSANDNVK